MLKPGKKMPISLTADSEESENQSGGTSHRNQEWRHITQKSRMGAHHIEIQHCVGNISNWSSISPEPCTALRVSESPNLPLMLSGAVNWAWYTFVGPISFLHTLTASCRANTYTSDGPLQHETSDNQTITMHNDNNVWHTPAYRLPPKFL